MLSLVQLVGFPHTIKEILWKGGGLLSFIQRIYPREDYELYYKQQQQQKISIVRKGRKHLLQNFP